MPVLTLKRVLLADAITCALVFVACVIDTAIVASVLGLPPAIVAAAGWICLPVALLLASLAMQAQPSHAGLVAIVYGNWGWVAASLAVVLLLGGQMSGAGIAIVTAQAAGVALLAGLEAKGLKAAAAV